mgnify:CR=1 FL=1
MSSSLIFIFFLEKQIKKNLTDFPNIKILKVSFLSDYHSACWKKTDKGDKFQSGSMISGPKYCGDPPEPNPNEIRLMSYNLFGWNALQDPEKTENMYRIIRAFNPDILGTQESEREDEIASNIGSDYR